MFYLSFECAVLIGLEEEWKILWAVAVTYTSYKGLSVVHSASFKFFGVC